MHETANNIQTYDLFSLQFGSHKKKTNADNTIDYIIMKLLNLLLVNIFQNKH